MQQVSVGWKIILSSKRNANQDFIPLISTSSAIIGSFNSFGGLLVCEFYNSVWSIQILKGQGYRWSSSCFLLPYCLFCFSSNSPLWFICNQVPGRSSVYICSRDGRPWLIQTMSLFHPCSLIELIKCSFIDLIKPAFKAVIIPVKSCLEWPFWTRAAHACPCCITRVCLCVCRSTAASCLRTWGISTSPQMAFSSPGAPSLMVGYEE